ncbi:hypothetical protein NL676_016180 [Syzygium grande]|nr:hypothetical protein NL676_016180 [Syzygium grande]
MGIGHGPSNNGQGLSELVGCSVTAGHARTTSSNMVRHTWLASSSMAEHTRPEKRNKGSHIVHRSNKGDGSRRHGAAGRHGDGCQRDGQMKLADGSAVWLQITQWL